ncbi:MAG: ribosomal protein S18-alanine N-acetyltransferase [Actinomycetales bacterium]|nr:ribosomal protein S18-alanine N-acetyltransferase [Actinomycetales bacterium]
MTTRTMRWWDVEDVVALERELFSHDPWTPEQFWGELAHVPETRWYAVHEDASGIDGYVGLFAVPPEADVQTIAVAPRSQGRGLGRELLDALVAEAVRRGCAQLFLEVRVDNAPAIALYERAGFEPQGRRSGYYGPGQDALVLRRRLAGDAP